MKLGILTFHCAHNYGAILQCFALQSYLKSLGHEVEIIDYRPWYLVRVYRKNSLNLWISRSLIRTLNKLKNELRTHHLRVRRFNNFDYFINSHLNLSPYSPDMDFNEYDALFIGSDQVWNKFICGGKYDPVYFGMNAKCPLIPYAASNKLTSLTDEESIFFKTQLDRFSFISVRESKLQEILQPLTLKEIKHVLDPTLLANDILFNEIEDKQPIKDKYVLIYEIDEHPEVINQAELFAKQHGYNIIILSAFIQATDLSRRDQTASPSDFINYIRHAECIFTTSFHGTALSIISKRKFFSFRQNNSSDMRIQSLLNMMELEDRFVDMNAELNNDDIDYSIIEVKLNKNINESRMFIKKALKSIKDSQNLKK